MNKSVLISIKPEWCEKIASRHKSIEVRKTRPKIETPYIDFFAKSQLTEVELLDYLGDHNGYGWHISDLVIYDHPRKLSEFYCHKPLVRPPMDWCYVEEL